MSERFKPNPQEIGDPHDPIELVKFLRNNPPGYSDGKSIVALTPEQVEANRVEEERNKKSRHIFEVAAAHLELTQNGGEHNISHNPIKRTRGI